LRKSRDRIPTGKVERGAVGRYLMSHIDQGTRGLTKAPIYPYRAPVVTSGIPEFRDGPFRSKHSAIRTSVSNEGWRHVGPQATALALIDRGFAGQLLRDKIAWRTSSLTFRE
jgi:glucose dehydrogenase